MTRTKVLLVAAFVVTFGAGAATGLLMSRPGHRPRGPSWLASELGLTDRQQEQMREIWSEAMRTAGPKRWEQRKALARQREDAIAALLTDEQRARYKDILRQHQQNLDELARKREQAFREAVERTKQILTPDQAARYEQLLKRRHEHGPGKRKGPPPPWGDRSPPDRKPGRQDPHAPPTPRGGSDDTEQAVRTTTEGDEPC